ncbi:HPF/RaiA family ribosome-associated protein [Crenobacter cavernae]|uniref:HPF/RaiA family ribosome-associated protein n=1 Tax=Crenobacter cavernae TaxID=2290923 RepID=A0ABY0F972_9NEIS|nr:HPF/RaiA family ribosome-associated protein [Crenobacter cavernae]RXZ42019.1 HPF/RaiA family ribosome-associated protein [Crenobacter cavernae]
MKCPLQISYENLPESEALTSHIRQKADKLEQVFQHLIACNVTVGLPHRHSQQGERYFVHIDVTAPGTELVSNKQSHEDVYVALRDAFDATRRLLEERARHLRGQTKQHAEPMHGTVARLLDDFGFIEGDDGNDYYFSPENLVDQVFDKLTEGTPVQFLPEVAQEGRQAKRISTGKHRYNAD